MEPPLTQGLAIGFVDPADALIQHSWHLVAIGGGTLVNYSTAWKTPEPRLREWADVSGETDFTHQFPLTGLQPATVYHYATETTGAGIMLMSDDVPLGSVCAADDVSALIERLQYDLGEGPCIDAFHSGRPAVWAPQPPPAAQDGGLRRAEGPDVSQQPAGDDEPVAGSRERRDGDARSRKPGRQRLTNCPTPIERYS